MVSPAHPPAPGALWGLHPLEPAGRFLLDVGPRRIWVQGHPGEVRIAPADTGEASDGQAHATPPAPETWSRWALPGKTATLRVTPALPDRTLVVTPEQAFHLLPGASARVFARVPIWIQIRIEPEGKTAAAGGMALEMPSVTLSDTWWGSVTEGELAYWLPTSARREVDPARHRPHMAICSLHLLNRSATPLPVDRLAIRGVHLSLFLKGDVLWSDEARVVYQGSVEGSQIELSGTPPGEAEDAELVASPRVPVQRGLRARTFQRFLTMAGQG